MVKITIEELEIIIKANLKQVIPQLKKVVKQVRETVKNSSEISTIVNKSQQIGDVTAKATTNATSNVNGYKKSLKQTAAQAEYLKSKIEELNYQLELADKRFEVGDTQKIEAQIERLTNQYNKLTTAQVSSNKESKKVSNSIVGINKMISTVKKYALALFSIRGIYSLISRASSAYFSFDTQQAKKAESIWVGLGAIVQPIVQGIMNVMAKGVAYINAFIKALTGIDLIARANTKALQAQAAATKEAAGVADFDEVHNIQDNSNSSGVSGSGISQIELPDVDTSKVEKFAKILKEIWEWIKENKNALLTLGVIIGSVFAAKELGDFISKLGEVKVSTEDIAKVLTGIGWAAILVGIIGYVTSLKEMLDAKTFEEFMNSLSKAMIFLGVLMLGVLLIFGPVQALVVGVIGLFALLVITLGKYGDQIKEGIEKFSEWLFGIIDKDWTEMFGPILGELLNGAVANFKNLFNGIKKIFTGIIDFIRGIFTGDWRRAWNGIKDIFVRNYSDNNITI